MVSNYHMIVISSAEEKKSAETVEAIKKLLKADKATLAAEESWGKKKLAYPIKKLKEGTYHSMKFSIDSVTVKAMDEKIKNLDGVVRHLILRQEKARKKKRVVSPKAKLKS